VDEVKVDRVVSDLVADYDRRDGYLTNTHVEILVEKRKLSVEESAEVYRQLSAIGISIEDDHSKIEEGPISDTGNAIAIEKCVIDGIDDRLRRLKTKLLTADEEAELGRRMELGRRAEQELKNGVLQSEEHNQIIGRALQAKEKMIVANLRLVLHVAKPYVGISDLNLDDMFQEGTVGLMRGVDMYDYKLGYKFSTYATWWIRQSITRAIADRGSTIRVPVHAYTDVYRLKRALRLLEQTYPARRVRIAEIADELDWTIDKVHFIHQISKIISTSSDELIKGRDDLSLNETFVSDLPSPEDEVCRIELQQCIEKVMSDIDVRQCTVLRLRFGLGDTIDGATLEEVGRTFGLTRERIRQIEAKALGKLKHPVRAYLLREHYD